LVPVDSKRPLFSENQDVAVRRQWGVQIKSIFSSRSKKRIFGGRTKMGGCCRTKREEPRFTATQRGKGIWVRWRSHWPSVGGRTTVCGKGNDEFVQTCALNVSPAREKFSIWAKRKREHPPRNRRPRDHRVLDWGFGKTPRSPKKREAVFFPDSQKRKRRPVGREGEGEGPGLKWEETTITKTSVNRGGRMEIRRYITGGKKHDSLAVCPEGKVNDGQEAGP